MGYLKDKQKDNLHLMEQPEPMKSKKVKYSIIVMLEEEHEDFPRFIRNLYDVFSVRDVSFEILVMANGSGSFLRDQLPEFQGFNHRLKAFEFGAKTTEAVCLTAGLRESRGEVVVVCGSYQQITNDSLNQLLDSLDDETHIVSPWRQHRVDPWFSQYQSRAFNFLVRKITRSNLHDLSCTVKVLRREVLEETEIYGSMYRYLPIAAARKGFKTKEVKCEHHQQRGKTGFHWSSEYITRFIEIFALYFNTRFSRKPLRFFSSIGLGFLLIGFLIMSYVFLEKFLIGYPIGDRPILLLAIFFMVLGVQTASVGLVGEIIAFTHGRNKKEYTIEKII
ncbi:MAG: glycosyltransferase [Candidatus Aenigmarchaeota archaeon]|nr:glycosyltransferase [Candidatus Aenigmarchaeota archaeon]